MRGRAPPPEERGARHDDRRRAVHLRGLLAPPGLALATAGGFVTELISAGFPEVTTTQLIVRCRLPPRVATATSVFVLAVAAVAGAAVHALAATPVWYVVAWPTPGVMIGGTIGTRVGKYVPSEIMEPALGVVFAVVLASELLA